MLTFPIGYTISIYMYKTMYLTKFIISLGESQQIAKVEANSRQSDNKYRDSL